MTHLCLEEIAVNPDALAGLLARKKPRHDSAVRVQTRRDVSRGDTDLGRRTVRLTGAERSRSARDLLRVTQSAHMHQTGLCLDNNVVPRRCTVRASLAISLFWIYVSD
jgi:hypothetical protein